MIHDLHLLCRAPKNFRVLLDTTSVNMQWHMAPCCMRAGLTKGDGATYLGFPLRYFQNWAQNGLGDSTKGADQSESLEGAGHPACDATYLLLSFEASESTNDVNS